MSPLKLNTLLTNFLIINLLTAEDFIAHGYAELSFYAHPPTIFFHGHRPLTECFIPDIYSTALGLPTDGASNWRGLYLSNPFNLAEAIVTITTEKIPSLSEDQDNWFPIHQEFPPPNIYKIMKSRIMKNYKNKPFLSVDLDASEGFPGFERYFKIFSNISRKGPWKVANKSFEVIGRKNVEYLKALAGGVRRSHVLIPDGVPDLFWINLWGIPGPVNLMAENSEQVHDAIKKAIVEVSNAFNYTYRGKALVNLFVKNIGGSRRFVRQGDIDPEFLDSSHHNVAVHYSKDFPGILALLFYSSFALCAALLMIVITMSQLKSEDPILYRMLQGYGKKNQ